MPIGTRAADLSLSATGHAATGVDQARKRTFFRIVRNLREVLTEHNVGADVLVGTVLAQWSAAAYPRLPEPNLSKNKRLLRATAVRELIAWVQNEDLLHGAYWLSSAYALLLDESQRKQLAMYFTPPSLTGRLLDDLTSAGVDFQRRTFFDPACGGAAFLVPIAQRMRAKLLTAGVKPRQVLDHIATHVYGADMDPTLCELSRHFLLMVLHKEIQTTRYVPSLKIACADSLLALTQGFGTMDVVTCNPPYRKMSAAETSLYRGHYSTVIEAQPNLYSLFIALCVKLMKPGGTCALVTPTSFLSGQNFSGLRTLLLHETRVINIGMVSDRLGVFMDVMQETALTLLQRNPVADRSNASANISVVSRDGNYLNVGTCALPNSGAAWPIPRTETDVNLLHRASRSRFRLADYGYLARIGGFVWNRDERPTYISAAMAKRNRGRTAVPLLWSSDIRPDGVLRFDGKRKSNSEPCFVSLGSKSHSYVVRNPSVVLQRVTSNDQPRRLVAAVVPQALLEEHGGFVGENHTVILERVRQDAVLSPEQMVALLSCPTVDRYFRCISGATNVSIFELAQLALPDPKRITALLQLGLSMAQAVTEAIGDDDAIGAKLHQ